MKNKYFCGFEKFLYCDPHSHVLAMTKSLVSKLILSLVYFSYFSFICPPQTHITFRHYLSSSLLSLSLAPQFLVDYSLMQNLLQFCPIFGDIFPFFDIEFVYVCLDSIQPPSSINFRTLEDKEWKGRQWRKWMVAVMHYLKKVLVGGGGRKP